MRCVTWNNYVTSSLGEICLGPSYSIHDHRRRSSLHSSQAPAALLDRLVSLTLAVFLAVGIAASPTAAQRRAHSAQHKGSGSNQPIFTVTDNWSGYLLPSVHTLLTKAEGSWRVPTLNCTTTPDGESSAWVGTGGVKWKTGGTSGALLQTGTNSDCDHGTQVNNAWTEKVPSNPNHQIVFSNFPIRAGDTIDAQVYKNASGIWCTRVTDNATRRFGLLEVGGSWNIYNAQGVAIGPEQGSASALAYGGGYSAEWVVEDPKDSESRTTDRFANFNSVTFNNLRTNLAHWSLPGSDAVDMVQHGALLSYPSPLVNGNFTVRCATAPRQEPPTKSGRNDGHLAR